LGSGKSRKGVGRRTSGVEMAQGSGHRAHGTGLRAQGTGLRAQGSGEEGVSLLTARLIWQHDAVPRSGTMTSFQPYRR
jgi:hypothetical protein